MLISTSRAGLAGGRVEHQEQSVGFHGGRFIVGRRERLVANVARSKGLLALVTAALPEARADRGVGRHQEIPGADTGFGSWPNHSSSVAECSPRRGGALL